MLLITNSGPLDVLGFIGRSKRYEDVMDSISTIAVGSLSVRVLGLEALIEEKKALGRDKDQAALRLLEAVLRKRGKNSPADDPYALTRFVQAQEDSYEVALAEIRNGRKQSHWMWYIFPQYDGLGSSSTSKRYAIKSLAEAEAYLGHPALGPRLIECTEAALRLEGRSALEVFGSPDDLKLKSCATLFACISPADSVFDRLLDKYFQGKRDEKTLRLISCEPTDT
ncbi:MAG TPA: DUF1810 domain-containing protein [Gammaproteobacteria bacterium]|nr:DUF1810 domain-containing protein [Gammaproteobacteria bacterium]